MTLAELEAKFLGRIDDTHFRIVESIKEADGVEFLCPTCFSRNKGSVGTHGVICWRPRVPQTTQPVPGRWEFQGTGISDLTLIARSSSVKLTAGCMAHFFIRNGAIQPA